MSDFTKKEIEFYMDIAFRCARMSHAERRKVGAIIVNDERIVSYGWNGMPRGCDNTCEDEFGNTKPDVLHAELNALMKLVSSHDTARGGTLFITLSPCGECAKMISRSGIRRVIYYEDYRILAGLGTLGRAGIDIIKLADYTPPETKMKNFSDNIIDPKSFKSETKRLTKLVWALFATNIAALSVALTTLYYLHH